jgi:hypothetical protein
MKKIALIISVMALGIAMMSVPAQAANNRVSGQSTPPASADFISPFMIYDTYCAELHERMVRAASQWKQCLEGCRLANPTQLELCDYPSYPYGPCADITDELEALTKERNENCSYYDPDFIPK